MVESNNTSSATEDFINVITELVDFKIYFTDERQSLVLIHFLIDEWGLKKYQAQILVKRIAPFVLTRMGDLSKVIGESTQRKLHSYFSKFDWYFKTSQKILNALKTIEDKSIDKVFAKPSEEELKAVIDDTKRWENLKPEYQAFVQLLLGQTALLDGLNELKKQLEQTVQTIITELSFSLDLVSPSFTCSSVDKSKASDGKIKSLSSWLTYTSQQVPLLGREKSLKMLDAFFEQEDNFSWWVITGAGGTGKSRLAFEAILKKEQEDWEVGFLPRAKLHDPDALSKWQQKKRTIIVIDYAAENPTAIDHWLAYFIQHQQQLAFPVRLLLLERESKQQDWWEKLLKEGSAEYHNRLQSLYTSSTHELEILSTQAQQEILQSFLNALESEIELPAQDNKFWHQSNKDTSNFKTLTDNGRPLFIGMIAIAIYEKGVVHIRHWTRKDLLHSILSREENNWSVYFDEADKIKKVALYNLLALSTLSGNVIEISPK